VPQIETGFLHTQGAPLYYEIAGQGQPVLLIHAGVADSRMWDEQFAFLAQHYRVIRYDLRGFGKSALPDGPFAHHEDPAALLDHFGIAKAHIIGISFGGKVALDFALTHLDLVASLVLVAPSVGGRPTIAEVQKFFAEEDALLEQGDLEAATELNLRLWVDGPKRTPEQVDPVVRKRVREMQLHAFTVPMPEGAQEIALTPPANTRLDEIRVPILLIVGDYDLPDKMSTVEELASAIPQARSIIFPGVAHMLTMERPEEFNQLVFDFLSHL